MGIVKVEYESEYDRGDLVVFEKNGLLLVGIIEGYYVDDNCFWYNIRVAHDSVYTYLNGGDVAEWDIKMKIEDAKNIEYFIVHGEDPEED